jgi:AraC family transcriptional regulator of adaptative response/methylated-DNA-[protein]-cysteine methyltransferase
MTTMLPLDEARWTAVVAREKTQRGRFVFGVVSTGIFCAPGCPARTPKPSNVRFFATVAEARQAG